ncbi:MAG: [Alistipes sp.]|nr:[FeFe] hydrogenase H-cluster radical SAM maturase HydE [Alistipes sp.]
MKPQLSPIELRALLNSRGEEAQYLRDCAARTSEELFGRAVYLRGLIEISSYCRNNCLYCGLRRDNTSAERYRLTAEQIIECCQHGYKAGLRTFVLQGGEDGYWTDERLVPLVESIVATFPDAAVTLSLGERSADSYKALRAAGASRYLLRHEAASESLYRAIHPAEMSYRARLEAIEHLLALGYQTGMGMMIGVPGQSVDDIAEDIKLIYNLKPQMVGIGPFIPHPATPFGGAEAGDIELVLNCIAIIRLMLPHALIPATTALATLCHDGHRRAIEAGANVIMPNLSPAAVRSKYSIYAGKAASGTEAAENLRDLEAELSAFGYTINYGKGDYNDTL